MHAVCEDYRAGATIDRRLDEADLAAGRKIACPTFVLWAQRLPRPASPLEVWRAWCTDVTGADGRSRAISSPRRTRRPRWPRCCRFSSQNRAVADVAARDASLPASTGCAVTGIRAIPLAPDRGTDESR